MLYFQLNGRLLMTARGLLARARCGSTPERKVHSIAPQWLELLQQPGMARKSSLEQTSNNESLTTGHVLCQPTAVLAEKEALGCCFYVVTNRT